MEQHAGKATGQGPAARPAAAGRDWRVAELCHQAALYVAIEAARRAGHVAAVPARPLLLRDVAHLEPAITAVLAAIVDALRDNLTARSMAEVTAEIRSVLDRVAGLPADADGQGGLATAQPTRSWDYVVWWTEAAGLVRELRTAVAKARASESRRAAEARGPAALSRWLGGKPRAAPASAATPVSDRLRSLLAEVGRTVGERHPVLWVAEQEGPLALTPESLADLAAKNDRKWSAATERAPPTQRACLEKLVDACAALRRFVTAGGGWQSPAPEAFRDWRRGLAEAATMLLGDACAEGPEHWPSPRTAGQWDVHVVGAAPLVVWARPLLVAVGAASPPSRLLSEGVVIVPRADRLVDRLCGWCTGAVASGDPPPRGVVRAVAQFPRGGEAVRLWDAVVREGRPRAQVVDWLLGLARLLTALHVDGDRSGDEAADGAAVEGIAPPAEFRVVAMLERLAIQPDGAGGSRRIPRPPGGRPANGSALVLTVRDAGTIPVGVAAEPAACSREAFDAIEDLDWRLWATASAAATPLLPIADDVRGSLGRLLVRARHDKWESLKTRLLASAADPATLAEAVRHLVIARLQIEGSSSPDGLSEALIADIRALTGILLGQLHDLDPAALGGLVPPRTRDGGVDIFRWRAGGPPGDGKGRVWEPAWRVDAAAFAEPIEERITPNNTIRITLSATSGATEEDLRLLAAPFVTTCPSDAAGTCFAPLARFGLEVMSPGPAGGMPDMAVALRRLRDDLAGPGRAEFDALVRAATAPEADEIATHWIALLKGDRRFGFDCHPPIDPVTGGRGFTIRPPVPADALQWEDSDTVPAGADLRVVHAIEPEHASRVLSRGRPAEGSPERLVAELAAACAGDLHPLQPAVLAIAGAIDRLHTFPAERPRLMKSVAERLGSALEELARLAAAARDDAPAEPALLACKLLSRLATCHGLRMLPDRWHPRSGTPASELPVTAGFAVAFHATVPSGDWIVDRFELSGEHPCAGEWRRSAGPPPAGYQSLRGLAAGLPETEPACQDLRRELADLPRHVLDEKSRLAIPSLYESIWKMLLEYPSLAGDPAPWKEAVAELIRKPFDMVMFEPAKLGDYPTAWIVGVDGNPPRGRRVVRVVRPGVRTLEKKLVWPAVVETE